MRNPNRYCNGWGFLIQDEYIVDLAWGTAVTAVVTLVAFLVVRP